MRRREFLAVIGGVSLARPLAARAQQPERTRRIGILSPGRSELREPTFKMLGAFLQGLQELGYTQGANLTPEHQYANGISEQLRELAAESVRRKPDIIVAFRTTAARPQATGDGKCLQVHGLSVAGGSFSIAPWPFRGELLTASRRVTNEACIR